MSWLSFLEPAASSMFARMEELIWSRQTAGRFPDIKELKQLFRDRSAPGKDLGHTDR